MKKMISTVTKGVNAIGGAMIALFAMLFGKYWIVFVMFFLFNLLDWMTGWMKARMLKKESSAVGLKGVIKKLGYWLMIALAFAMSVAFIELGKIIGIDLQVSTLIGYFVLASLMVNECRSIIENLVEMDYKIPKVLTQGLEVVDKLVNKDEGAE
ncbi:toxin secretion/phage lysis holin [Breznakia sp. PH1-1]|nr:toxin secretion/phage lysis holin [Breznakia sp. PH1-1]MDH6404638.1 toxin secretion/phage lysis holin [Breznakia sp. PF1-11]MDH6412398.1 toxin secretion/phage lysis holin [Breznakia sp. PFB1-11]MDH6414736.1 toxin secretion/phage lysis holin [Breznakia sp. PFB1-14]MDH6417019.1 toxin secretion/phage lysis holin [Breznakia sp. PFB1-4]MDH6419431.1 toxin secretion/phage lysis holin [Breznakia sp. PFB1-12]MDH6474463.1 toxin secretion/phage lysis holin [Breznakia sp. PFB2-30]MDH6476808.1 toxin s